MNEVKLRCSNSIFLHRLHCELIDFSCNLCNLSTRLVHMKPPTRNRCTYIHSDDSTSILGCQYIRLSYLYPSFILNHSYFLKLNIPQLHLLSFLLFLSVQRLHPLKQYKNHHNHFFHVFVAIWQYVFQVPG